MLLRLSRAVPALARLRPALGRAVQISASKPISGLGIHMSSVLEYSLRNMGPWEGAGGGGNEATTTTWVSPDPLRDGCDIYYDEVTERYISTATMDPVYFAGTNPRQCGFPPPEDARDVGTPREQWEASLRSEDPEAWDEYRNERRRELGHVFGFGSL